MENKQLQVFQNAEFGKIRVVEKDGEPWFVAVDVCKALELEQVSRAMDRLDEDERGLLKVTHRQSPTKTQEVNGVNESGLYHLVLCSTKPEAKAFKRWITHEVIPSIRKYGAYMTPEKLEEAICNPDTMIEICMQLKLEQEKRKQVEAENRQIKPKADYFDNLVEIGPNTNLRDTAKEFCCPPSHLINWLLSNRYLYRDSKERLKPYQSSMKAGLFVLKEYCVNNHAGLQVLVTPKGRGFFRVEMIDDD